MGLYINPKDTTKERWLLKHAELLASKSECDVLFEGGDYLPVCLVDNGPFTAAAIAYCKEELEVFRYPEDYRLKTFYKVSKKDLLEVCPELERYLDK
jgi:hypothetical protein